MRRVVPWVVVALAVLAAGTWLLRGRDDAPKAASRSEKARAAAPAQRQTTASPPPAAGSSPAPQAPSPDLAALADPAIDPFEYLRGLAQRAFDGDAKAQYLIARELDKCWVVLLPISKESDPEAAIWARGRSWTPTRKEHEISEYRRCKRLLTEDPFAALPARKGGYSFVYWRERSAEEGYPVSVIDREIVALASEQFPESRKGIDRGKALDTITTAAMSSEPDALLSLGFLTMMSTEDTNTARMERGAAIMMAACRLGADCTSGRSLVPIRMCYETMSDPRCGPDDNVEQMLVVALAPAVHARAYADSAQIETAVRNGDADAFRRWLDRL